MPAKPRSDRAGYILTALIVGGMIAVLTAAGWFEATHQGRLFGQSKSFGPGWTCERIEDGHLVCSKAPPRKHPMP